jgi:hypothetical protein
VGLLITLLTLDEAATSDRPRAHTTLSCEARPRRNLEKSPLVQSGQGVIGSRVQPGPLDNQASQTFVVRWLFFKQNRPAPQFLHQLLCEIIVHYFDDTAHDLFDANYGMVSMAYSVRRCTRIPVERRDKFASPPR